MGRKSYEQSTAAWDGGPMCDAARAVTFESMVLFFKVALWAHVLAGAVALSVFWLPLVTRKGGKTHVRVGWVYVVAAGAIAVTAFVNCARMLTDAIPANDGPGIFLAYIGVIAAASAQIGVRALRSKKREAPSRNPIDLLPPMLLVAGGLALGALGLHRRHAPLFLVFASLGIFLGATQLRFWLRAPATKHEWFFMHMAGMGGSCITTVTAFLVVNAPRLGLGSFDLVVWLTPGIVGGVGLRLWRAYYTRRFNGRRPTPAASPASPASGVI